MISARVIADSITPDGVRLTTVEATFNRYILAEVNTYREWSRNSASSRAVPVEKVMRQVWSNPATPIHWGRNQRGMQARAELTGWRRWLARKLFLAARVPVLVIVWMLTKLKLHKQVANRLLEPWVWHTAVISSTNWENMFGQRDHEDAQPEFRQLARCIRWAIAHSIPKKLEWGEWHLPYIVPEDYVEAASLPRDEASDWFPDVVFMSVSRCAAVSYVRQNERNVRKDIALSVRLREGRHWSPFEHVAIAEKDHTRDSNFDAGWKQLRKFYAGEDGRG
jgi:hypothetical protein